MSLTRVPSQLGANLEQLISQVIGCCIDVHRAIGPGLSELVYVAACCIELQHQAITFEREKALPVRYRGQVICHHRVDILVAQQLVVEVKSVERLHPVHIAQAVSYLRLTGAPVALVVNFNVEVLKHGLRRVVL